jgi:hypothetical protein
MRFYRILPKWLCSSFRILTVQGQDGLRAAALKTGREHCVNRFTSTSK